MRRSSQKMQKKQWVPCDVCWPRSREPVEPEPEEEEEAKPNAFLYSWMGDTCCNSGSGGDGVGIRGWTLDISHYCARAVCAASL